MPTKRYQCEARHRTRGDVENDSLESFDELSDAVSWCFRQQQYQGFYKAYINNIDVHEFAKIVRGNNDRNAANKPG